MLVGRQSRCRGVTPSELRRFVLSRHYDNRRPGDTTSAARTFRPIGRPDSIGGVDDAPYKGQPTRPPRPSDRPPARQPASSRRLHPASIRASPHRFPQMGSAKGTGAMTPKFGVGWTQYICPSQKNSSRHFHCRDCIKGFFQKGWFIVFLYQYFFELIRY